MHIKATVVSATYGRHFDFGNSGEVLENASYISLGLVGSDKTEIWLKTGEVFCSPARQQTIGSLGNPPIQMTIDVFPQSAVTADYTNFIAYHNEHADSNAPGLGEICGSVTLPDEAFDDLVASIKQGTYPARVQMLIDGGSVVRNGLGVFHWDNASSSNTNLLPIIRVEFEFDLLSSKHSSARQVADSSFEVFEVDDRR